MLLILSEEVVDKLVERLVARIEEGNEYVLKKIGSTIKSIGTITPTQVHELSQIIQYGGDYDKIVKKLAEITNINTKEIYEIFDEITKSNYSSIKPLYEYNNASYIPYEENTILRNQVRALAQITADKYINIMNTLAFSRKGKNGRIYYTDIGKMYQEIVDTGILNISQGKETFDSAMSRIIKELSNSGIRTVDYESGKSMRVDSAVRMHLKDAITNLHNETQKIYGEQFKSDGVEISVHAIPAPDHALVQGRQFSNEEFEKFQTDQDATSYNGILFPATSEETGHDRRSIGQYNCYHYIFPVILGISRPEYTDEQLQKIIDESNKIIEIDNHKYTKYECTQLQRRIETEVRKEKEKHILAKASGTKEGKEIMAKSQEKIDQLASKYKEVSEKSGLPTYMERMRISGYHRTGPRINKVNEIEINTKEDLLSKWNNKYENDNITVRHILKADPQLIDEQITQVDNLLNKYNFVKNDINKDSRTNALIIQVNTGDIMGEKNYARFFGGHYIEFNEKYFKDSKLLINNVKEKISKNWWQNIDTNNYNIYPTTHEFGHLVEYKIIDNIEHTHGFKGSLGRGDYIIGDLKIYREISKRIPDIDKYLSDYGKSTPRFEWFAETFTQMELGQKTPLTEALEEYIKEYMGGNYEYFR